MKARVKEGKRFGAAKAGEIIDVPEYKIALVPWCLEPVDNAGESKPAPEKKPAKKK